MGHFVEKLKKQFNNSSHAFVSKDCVTDYYVSDVYDRIAKQLKDNDIKLSTEAVDEITSKPILSYVINFNWGHRIMHEMHSHDDISFNPRDKRYHDLQYAESLTWMIIKLADDIIDSPDAKGKVKPREVTDYINSIVFSDNEKLPELNIAEAKKEGLQSLALCLREQLKSLDATEKFKQVIDKLSDAWDKEASCKTMQEYREAKREVSLKSANVALFYILGAGDSQYADRYFHDQDKITGMLKTVSVAGNYTDSFFDFNRDKVDVLKDISPTLQDRIWFLGATIKELSQGVPEFNSKQMSHFLGLIARPIHDNIAEKISPDFKDKQNRRIEKIVSYAKNALLGTGKEHELLGR